MASVGEIIYQVDMDVKGLLTGEQQVNKAMSGLERSSGKATDAMSRLDTTAAHVSAALKMPTVDKLSRDLAQLSGKMGANSAATEKAAQANYKFTGVIGTVSGALGAGYVGNVGNATNSLLRHAQAAIAATSAEVANAEAITREAAAYQSAASKMALVAKAKREVADSAVKAAESEVANLSSFEASVDARQKELALLRDKQSMSAKEAENNYKILASEGNLREVQKTKAALYATEDKIKKHLATTGREVEQVENKLTAAKAAQAKITLELNAATALEQKAKITSAAANDTLAAAQARVAQTSSAQAVAMNGLRNIMALFGGPMGILMLAAAGVYALYQAMNDKSAIEKYRQEIDDAAKRVEYLTKVQAEANSVKTKMQLEVDTKSLKEAEDKVKSFENAIATMSGIGGNAISIGRFESQLSLARDTMEELSESVRIGNDRLVKFGERADSAGSATAKLAKGNEIYGASAKELIESNNLLNKTIELGSPAAAEMEMALESLKKKLMDVGYTADETDIPLSNLRNKLEAKADKSFELMLVSIEENVTALKIEMQEGTAAAAEYRATLNAAAMGMTDDDQINRYISGMKEIASLQKQRTDQKKSERASASAAKKEATEAEKLKQKITDLANATKVAELETKGLSREAAVLEAVQKLGSKANTTQIAEVTELAGKEFDLTQKIKDRKEAFEQNPRAKADQSLKLGNEQLERQLEGDLVTKEQYQKRSVELSVKHAQEIAEINAKSVVTPAQEMAAQVDPVQALANEHARKLALIKEYENQKVITQMQSIQLMRVANEEFDQQRIDAQWAIWRNQSLGNEMAAAAFDSLAGNASNALTGIITQSMTAADAARSIGNTVLNSVINSFVQAGIAQAKAAWFGAGQQQAAIAATAAVQTTSIATQTAVSTAAAATTTAAWTPAAIMASIASMGTAAKIGLAAVAVLGVGAIAGKRKNGGPVSAGEMYQIGEGGKPEIFKASNGSQYMIPGDNGKVISNKDIGGGGVNFQVIVENHVSNAMVEPRMEKGMGGEDVARIIIKDMHERGPIHRSITDTTSANSITR